MSKLNWIIFFLFGYSHVLFAQLNDGINDPYHNWDGVSHFTDYITVTPGLMGPNALPVPKLQNGLVDTTFVLSGGFTYHQNAGDNTPTVTYRLIAPIGKKASFEISGPLVEWFNMSPELRYKRRTFKLRGEGVAFGDLWSYGHFQILKDHKVLPDISGHVGIKTALGTEIQTVRFSDTPGYLYFVSFGKTADMPSINGKARIYGHTGFFAWQTYNTLHRQNDAVMYGLGVELTIKNYTLHHELTGFSGYLKNGDRPMVYRLRLSHQHQDKMSFEFQYGINDYDYTSFSVVYSIIRTKKHPKHNEQ